MNLRGKVLEAAVQAKENAAKEKERGRQSWGTS